jgi:hypothetical protein
MCEFFYLVAELNTSSIRGGKDIPWTNLTSWERYEIRISQITQHLELSYITQLSTYAGEEHEWV